MKEMKNMKDASQDASKCMGNGQIIANICRKNYFFSKNLQFIRSFALCLEYTI